MAWLSNCTSVFLRVCDRVDLWNCETNVADRWYSMTKINPNFNHIECMQLRCNVGNFVMTHLYVTLLMFLQGEVLLNNTYMTWIVRCSLKHIRLCCWLWPAICQCAMGLLLVLSQSYDVFSNVSVALSYKLSETSCRLSLNSSAEYTRIIVTYVQSRPWTLYHDIMQTKNVPNF